MAQGTELELVTNQPIEREAAAAAEEDGGAEQPQQQGIFDAAVRPEDAPNFQLKFVMMTAISIQIMSAATRVNRPRARHAAATSSVKMKKEGQQHRFWKTLRRDVACKLVDREVEHLLRSVRHERTAPVQKRMKA